MGRITNLAVPAFFTLIAEPLFLLADSAIVGHVGTPALAALGAASAVLLTATGIFVFLAYATTAIVAKQAGSGDTDGAITAGLNGAWLAVIISIPTSLLLALFAHPISVAIGGVDVADQAASYLRISAIGLPAMLIALALQGTLRGLQDTKTPLIATSVGFALNTALNAFLVLTLHWGIAGSATGTVIAQWLMTGWMLRAVVVRARHLTIRFDLLGVLEAAKAGAPLLVRTLALRAALMLTTAVAGGMGATTLAAHQVASTVFSFLSFALDALAIAAQALTGDALGRKNFDDVRTLTAEFVRLGWRWGFVAGAILAAIAWWVPLGFSSDPHVRIGVFWALVVMAVIQPIAGVLFVLDGVLMGAGDGVFLAKAQLVVLAAYLPLIGTVALFRGQLENAGVGWEMAALWTVYSIYLALRCFALNRRRLSGGFIPSA